MARPPKQTVLWNFTGGVDGGNPIGGVISDRAGNLYGGTIAGGAYDQGTIFEIVPSNGTYREKTLVAFDGSNGSSSTGALVMDSNGALYGVTAWGGKYGYGTAFRLSAKGDERVIWSFGAPADGANPAAGMVIDARGDLFGTTNLGGPFGGGNVFELTRSGRRYTESILWNFGKTGDGRFPAAPLTIAPDGSLFGTAAGGGSGCSTGCGVVFKLTPSGSKYSESIVYKFQGGPDGRAPNSSLTVDAAGAMYGVTDFGGGTPCASDAGCGTLFKLTPSASGYTESILWAFGKGSDGYYPLSNVVIGPKGRLYGTTWQGGPHYGGVFYELVPHGARYRERILFDYDGGVSGGDPRGNIVADANHRLYGAAYVGGSSEFPDGTVFRLTP